MNLPDPELLLVRYGELALKGGNRSRFEGALVNNLRDGLKPYGGAQVRRQWGRILVWPKGRFAASARAVTRCFGIKSVSPTWQVEPTLEAMAQVGLPIVREELARWTGQGLPSFRVRVRRADKSFPLTSGELERQLADAVLVDDEHRVRIDLREADIELGVELRPEGCFVFGERLPGPGGLPVGTLGKGVCLLSGGIDSPVAAWLAMKRGMRVSFIAFHSPPYLGEGSRAKVQALVRTLSEWQGPSRLLEVPFTEVQLAIRGGAPERLRTILYRRSMSRIATAQAERIQAKALITGESLGQVASQTLENLTTIEDAAGLPVLRPLITADKEEAIALAERIGTFSTSIQPEPDCCTVFQPRQPALKSSAADCRELEAGLDLERLEAAALEAATDHLL